jgi:hypothetical protein
MSEQDFRSCERVHIPRVPAGAMENALPAQITPGSVTTPKRSPLLSVQQTVIIPAGGPTAITFTHGLGVLPNCTVDAGDDNIFTSINSVTTTTVRISAYNFGSTVTRTVTLLFW